MSMTDLIDVDKFVSDAGQHRQRLMGAALDVLECPVNPLSLQNPDFLCRAQSGLIGVYAPSMAELKDPDSLVRRIVLSRFAYSSAMITILVIPPEMEPHMPLFYQICSVVRLSHQFNFDYSALMHERYVRSDAKPIAKYVKRALLQRMGFIGKVQSRISKLRKDLELEQRVEVGINNFGRSPALKSWYDGKKKYVEGCMVNQSSLIFDKKYKGGGLLRNYSSLFTYSVLQDYYVDRGTIHINPNRKAKEGIYLINSGSGLSDYSDMMSFQGFMSVDLGGISIDFLNECIYG